MSLFDKPAREAVRVKISSILFTYTIIINMLWANCLFLYTYQSVNKNNEHAGSGNIWALEHKNLDLLLQLTDACQNFDQQLKLLSHFALWYRKVIIAYQLLVSFSQPRMEPLSLKSQDTDQKLRLQFHRRFHTKGGLT